MILWSATVAARRQVPGPRSSACCPSLPVGHRSLPQKPQRAASHLAHQRNSAVLEVKHSDCFIALSRKYGATHTRAETTGEI